MSDRADDDLTLLIVSADGETAGSIDNYAEGTGVTVLQAGDAADARGRLDGGGIDCLVVDVNALPGDGEESVTDLAAAPDCPVVLLTDRGPETLDDGTIGAAATIVEKGEDPRDWSFLLEKIRGVVHSQPAVTHEDAGDQEMYRTLVESARDGLYRLDADGVFTYLNGSFADILGYEREELLGTHTAIVMAEGELERGQETVRQVLASDERGSDLMDMTMETKSGEQITAAIHFVVLTDAAGRYDGLMGVMRDITDRKERERALQRQNERLEEFASIVSHDLRNPLNVAQGNLSLFEREVDSEHLDTVASALDRMERLIDETLELARHGEVVTEIEPVALREVVTGCWEMVATGEATLDPPDAGVIRADPERVKQLFENLFRNSVEHAGPGVAITVGTTGEGFYVADDGPGIPAEEREQVFKPGYSGSEDGTGFGLTIVKRIVEAHGWMITVTDSETGGARFEVSGVTFAEE